ncbi:L-lactate permease [Bacillus sp. B15-48]|uniref:L-lactate permease n=1 Tax=Bacillus sp. B15-48 TaxID=1548601 RepID=UPI00193FFF11|nr:L-lactate permease [Bacillus sp. B15-48]MBM4762913.1 L-lactate permease [Bacillus sp. B15-48]
MLLLIALSAIIVPFLMLVILKMPAAKGMTVSAIVVIVLAFFTWGMEGQVILASILQGAHKTLTILWILFGALILLNTLRNTGAITRINQGFQFISADMRVQAVIVAFLFGSLIEGAAGFGTPAMVTGPLMIALGFTPIAAATIALIADSTAVPFGAVGTPVAVGLSNIPGASIPFYDEIAYQITFLDLFAGTFLPFILIGILTSFFGKNKRFKDALPMLPWTLVIGILYTSSAFLYATFFGHEFVSILASLTILLFATVTARKGWLLPKTEWKEAMQAGFKEDRTKSDMGLITAWSPYLVVVGLLLLTRIVPWLNHFALTAIDFSWRGILGIEEIRSNWEFLYSPGTILTVSAFFAFLIQRKSIKTFTGAMKESLGTMKMTSFALLATLAMVQVFSNSGLNASELMSMPQYIAQTFAVNLGFMWIFVAPFLGQLGAFITGSAAVSTLTFSPIQYNVANQIGLDQNIVLASQILGAAAGNMICVHNVVAASAVVELAGKEGEIIRKTLIPAVIYGLLIGIAGFIKVNFL